MRVAIVGYGVMGRNHARVIKALGHDVITIDPAGHADLRYPLELRQPVDAAIIATPLMELASAASEWFAVPTLVEKPGFAAIEEWIWVGYTERFNPDVQALAERIGGVRVVHTGRLGGPPRHDVSAAVDLATHDLDLLGMLGVDRDPVALLGDEHDFTALLGGATLWVSHRYPVKRRRIVVDGTPHMEADLIAQRLWVDGIEVPVRKAEPLLEQDAAFLRGDDPPVSLADAAETLRLASDLETFTRRDLTGVSRGANCRERDSSGDLDQL